MKKSSPELDWQNPGDYKYTKKLSRAGWAWEFLRRNSDFIADFNETQKRQGLWEEAAASKKNDYLLSSKIEIEEEEFVPPRKPGQSINAWLHDAIANGLTPHRLSPQHALDARWGLTRLKISPGDVYHPKKVRFLRAGHPTIFDTWEDLDAADFLLSHKVPRQYASTRISPTHALVSFDLRAPLKDQIGVVSKALRIRQKVIDQHQGKVKKDESTLWCVYLRILDALEANVSKSSVATVLDDPELESLPSETIAKRIRSAKRLTSRDEYAKLILGTGL